MAVAAPKRERTPAQLEADQRARDRQATLRANRDSASPSAPSEAPRPDPLALILGKLTQMDDRLMKLETSPAVPTFVPMATSSAGGAAGGYDPRGLPEGIGTRDYIPASLTMTENGQFLDQVVVRQFLQRFQSGSRVRLNLKAERNWRGNEHATWADVVQPLKALRCQTKVGPQGKQQCPGTFDAGESCPSCNRGPEVTKVYGLRDDGQWLYQVRVPGLTNTPEGMAFADGELLAA